MGITVTSAFQREERVLEFGAYGGWPPEVPEHMLMWRVVLGRPRGSPERTSPEQDPLLSLSLNSWEP